VTARVVSVLEVAEASLWSAVRAAVDLDAHVVAWRSDLRCEVAPSFRAVLPALAARGLGPLVKSARRPAPSASRGLPPAELPRASLALLHRAQRHAVHGRFLDRHALDPEQEVAGLRPLLGAGWVIPDPADPRWYALHPALPPPPPLVFDAADALLPPPDDLAPPRPGPHALLHDAASLAAAIAAVPVRRSVSGPLLKADEKRLAAHLGIEGPVETAERWGRAFRALDALQVVSTDPITREVHLDLQLEVVLEGDAADAVQALLERLVEADLRPLLELVRAALHQAGEQAVDDVIFSDLVREQQRTVLFWPWSRDGERVYPGDEGRAFDDEGFDEVEARMIGVLLARLERLGVITRAPGVFAATPDGRVWARAPRSAAPPVWVTSDLEVVVPPDAVSPWERFQLERLGRCLGRDAVDRYRLERRPLEAWLRTHDLDEALGWLRRRAPGLPRSVEDTLRGWARAASRVVLWEGIVEESEPAAG
jgi:hypothetical protein